MPYNAAKRPARIEGDIAYIPLTKGYEAIIDAADAPLVEDFIWTAAVRFRGDGSLRTVYAYRLERNDDGRRRQVSLHRVICCAPDGMDVDHHDGDGLNCRRSNLRVATRSQNLRNARTRVDSASGRKGVRLHKASGLWHAAICADKKTFSLGYHKTREDAAAAYAKASAKLHGEFGRTS